MTVGAVRLTARFTARLEGVDISRSIGAARAEIRAALCSGGRHPASPDDTTRHRRLMQRTTVSGDPAALAGASTRMA